MNDDEDTPTGQTPVDEDDSITQALEWTADVAAWMYDYLPVNRPKITWDDAGNWLVFATGRRAGARVEFYETPDGRVHIESHLSTGEVTHDELDPSPANRRIVEDGARELFTAGEKRTIKAGRATQWLSGFAVLAIVFYFLRIAAVTQHPGSTDAWLSRMRALAGTTDPTRVSAMLTGTLLQSPGFALVGFIGLVAVIHQMEYPQIIYGTDSVEGRAVIPLVLAAAALMVFDALYGSLAGALPAAGCLVYLWAAYPTVCRHKKIAKLARLASDRAASSPEGSPARHLAERYLRRARAAEDALAVRRDAALDDLRFRNNLVWVLQGERWLRGGGGDPLNELGWWSDPAPASRVSIVRQKIYAHLPSLTCLFCLLAVAWFAPPWMPQSCVTSGTTQTTGYVIGGSPIAVLSAKTRGIQYFPVAKTSIRTGSCQAQNHR